MASAAPSADRLWRFSLAVYDRPGVGAACLRLQDRRGLDVNLLLWCCWHAAEGRALSPEDLRAAMAGARPWQAEVVQPLRTLRRRLKAGVPAVSAERVAILRSGLKEVELEAERIAQAGLSELAAGRASGDALATLAGANLAVYLAARNITPEAEDEADLGMLVGAAPT